MSTEYEKVREMLKIDPSDLGNEFVQAPDVLAYFVEQYYQAERAHLHAKMTLEQTEARLQIFMRESLIARAKAEALRDRQIEDQRYRDAKAAGEPYTRVDVKHKAPTVGEIANAVLASDEYAAARLAYIEAECESKRVKGWCDVARAKRDMLTNLGMRTNAELRGAGWTPSASPGIHAAAEPLMRDDETPF